MNMSSLDLYKENTAKNIGTTHTSFCATFTKKKLFFLILK